jgi:branched-chain amino acid transport system ATP-binding protein
MSTDDTVLRVSGVSKRFGGLQALSDVGLTIRRGQVYGLIGPNGAGKTTFFNVITGLYTPDSGSFELAGNPYRPEAVHQVAEAGIARTFQNIRLFAEMTALENVMVGRHVRTRSGVLGAVLRTAAFRQALLTATSGGFGGFREVEVEPELKDIASVGSLLLSAYEVDYFQPYETNAP